MACDFCKRILSDSEVGWIDENVVTYDNKCNRFAIQTAAGDPYDTGILDDVKFCPYCGEKMYFGKGKIKMDARPITLEQTLKDLSARGFKIEWRYEAATNSIIVRLEKPTSRDWQFCFLNQRVNFDSALANDRFDLFMVDILNGMAEEIERQTTDVNQ